MENEKRILEEVEKTLKSIDNLPNLEPNPFLFTRLKTEINKKELKRPVKIKRELLLKPITLIIILAINLITAVFFFQSGNSAATNVNTSLTESLSKDYQISRVQYENLKLE